MPNRYMYKPKLRDGNAKALQSACCKVKPDPQEVASKVCFSSIEAMIVGMVSMRYGGF